MRVTFSGFRGTAPANHPEDLAADMATEAVDTKGGRGILEPWRKPVKAHQLPHVAQDIHRFMDTWWLSTAKPTEFCRVPLANDPNHYTVMTDEDYPKITRADVATSGGGPYPSTAYRLGLPIPAALVAVAADNPDWDVPDPVPEFDELDLFNVTYKVALVDDWGREGPGSLPSNNVNILEHEDQMTKKVTLTLPPVPTGAFALTAGKAKWRLYRFNMSSSGQGVYQFLADCELSATEYVDVITSDHLQEAMLTDEWIGPPDDDNTTYPGGTMRNVCSVASLFMAGHNDNMVVFSEPGTTHAWPAAYYKPHSEKILGIIPRGGDLVVLTDGCPYIYTGVHPSAMSPIKLSDPVPLASPRGIAEVGGLVFFVSHRGLVAIDQYSLNLLSKNYFTDAQWAAMNPKTMRLHTYRQYLLLHTDSGTFTLDVSAPDDGFRKLTDSVHSSFLDGDTDDCYFVDGDEIHKLDAGEPQTYIWKSKVHNFFDPVLLSCGRIRANQYPVTVTVCQEKLNGDIERYQRTAHDDRFFYIPAQSQCHRWWVEVSSAIEIRTIDLASSPAELMQ